MPIGDWPLVPNSPGPAPGAPNQWLDSEYEWGVNNGNIGSLNSQQLTGLNSLFPQVGLSTPKPAASLDPSAQFPTVSFNPTGASDFSFEQQAYEPTGLLNSQVLLQGTPTPTGTAVPGWDLHGGSPENTYRGPVQILAPTVNLDTSGGSTAPDFDPNYPNESMLALKNWLTPQVEAGAVQAMQGRGNFNSGATATEGQNAAQYLNQLSPLGVTPQDALGMDMERLYGPQIASALEGGGSYGAAAVNMGNAPGNKQNVVPSITGVTPSVSPATNDMDAILVNNPKYNQQDKSTTPAFGLMTLGQNGQGGSDYETPGYWYSPYSSPQTPSWENPPGTLGSVLQNGTGTGGAIHGPIILPARPPNNGDPNQVQQ